MECKVSVKNYLDSGLLLKGTVYTEDGERIHDAIVRVKKINGLDILLIGHEKTNPLGKFQVKIKDISSSYKISVFEEEVHMKKLTIRAVTIEQNESSQEINMSIIVGK